MKPFNLEAALAGAQIVTRGGQKVNQLHQFTNVDFCLVGQIENKNYLDSWTVTGTSMKNCGNHRDDLFMAPVKKTGWIAINPKPYGNSGCKYVSEFIYPTREACVANSFQIAGWIIQEISWEE